MKMCIHSMSWKACPKTKKCKNPAVWDRRARGPTSLTSSHFLLRKMLPKTDGLCVMRRCSILHKDGWRKHSSSFQDWQDVCSISRWFLKMTVQLKILLTDFVPPESVRAPSIAVSCSFCKGSSSVTFVQNTACILKLHNQLCHSRTGARILWQPSFAFQLPYYRSRSFHLHSSIEQEQLSSSHPYWVAGEKM